MKIMDIKLEGVCPICGNVWEVEVNEEDYNAYYAGELVQNAFPYLSANERECLISHFCEECQKNMFGEAEDYEESTEDGFDPYMGTYTWDC